MEMASSAVVGHWDAWEQRRTVEETEQAWRESAGNRVTSMLRDAAHEAADFVHQMDLLEPWTCERADLVDLLDQAPLPSFQGLLYAIAECRTQWDAAQDGAHHALSATEMLAMSSVADRLERELDDRLEWAAELESTDVFGCERGELDYLFISSTSDLWRGYLAGVMQFRAATDSLLVSPALSA
jgi:hypothetical protein